MSSTYTGNNGFEKPGSGEQATTWGLTANNDFDLIDQACDGYANITLSSLSYTLNIAQGASSTGRNKTIVFSGTPSGPVTVTVTPNTAQKTYWFINLTGQTITVQQLGAGGTAGTTTSILAGASTPAYCDGAGNVVGLTSASDVAFQVGRLNVRQIYTIGDTPVTLTLGSGAGTGAVVNPGGATICTDIRGGFYIVAGSSPAASSPIITVTLTSARDQLATVISPSNAATAALSGSSTPWLTYNGSGSPVLYSSWSIYSNTTPLTASGGYQWSYVALQ